MFTKQVRPILLDEVQQLLPAVDILQADEPYQTNIKQWLQPIIDLSDFYVYPINGITEGLNYWMGNDKRTILRDEGDYEWVDRQSGVGTIRYVSCPSSIDGNHRDIPTDLPVALDLAYVGTTAVKQIPMTDNIEYVFYSLSKPFGLKNARTGWMFTRKRDIKLHRLVYKNNYYNYVAHNLAERVIASFELDYVWNKFKDKQQTVCQQFDLTASDCVWLATMVPDTTDSYNSFVRTNGIARLCITSLYDE